MEYLLRSNQTAETAANTSFPYCPNAMLSTSSQLILICLNSFCCVLAAGGNILVLLAIYKTRSLRNISMYFLASLSFADLLVATTMNPLYAMIVSLYNYEDDQLPPNFFLILTKIENFFWVQSSTATTFSLCAVSVDRYIAVIFSLRYQELVTNRRCAMVVSFVWGFSFLFSATLFLYKDFDAREVFWLIFSILTVGIPFMVILYCNIKMAAAARRQIRRIRELSIGGHSELSQRRESCANRKATVMAIIVSGMFFLLFFPGMIVFAMLLIVKDECRAFELNIVWLWAATISFLHSVFNPCIYCAKGREFRKAIKKLLCC